MPQFLHASNGDVHGIPFPGPLWRLSVIRDRHAASSLDAVVAIMDVAVWLLLFPSVP